MTPDKPVSAQEREEFEAVRYKSVKALLTAYGMTHNNATSLMQDADFQSWLIARAQRSPAAPQPGAVPLFVIFDGPPSHKSGRFVEVETADGKSVGQETGITWSAYDNDGLYRLGPFYASGRAVVVENKPAEVPYEPFNIPDEIAQSAREVIRWFAARNIKDWTLLGIGPQPTTLGDELGSEHTDQRSDFDRTCQAILYALVDLKDVKDCAERTGGPLPEFYHRRKPEVWKRARAAVQCMPLPIAKDKP